MSLEGAVKVPLSTTCVDFADLSPALPYRHAVARFGEMAASVFCSLVDSQYSGKVNRYQVSESALGNGSGPSDTLGTSDGSRLPSPEAIPSVLNLLSSRFGHPVCCERTLHP